MLCKRCRFETERLRVREWHSFSTDEGQQQDLAQLVAAMLTEPVTRSLPAAWHGAYTVKRARAWIEERDNEGATLLVIDKSTNQAIGLLILFEMDTNACSFIYCVASGTSTSQSVSPPHPTRNAAMTVSRILVYR